MDHSPNRFGGNGVESILANYKLGKTLGIGSFGKVKIAEHVVTGHKVAIKILNRRKIKNMEMEEKVGREIKILRLFMHHHIIRQYEVIETPSDIYVVMEYVKSGELFDYIVEKGRLQEEEARNFFQQIISGVEYCHRNMVVHRDLKPENLLLDSRCNIKIADFGLSNVMRDGHFLKTSCGSPNYAAPEVISGKLYAGPEVDVWSCGVILYALLCGTLPFDDENIPNLFKKIKGGIYTLPSHLSPDARDLIPRMLVVDPVKRISIPEIRQHRWFQTHLPRYLAVAPPDTLEQAKKINEEIVQEVVNMGFDRNQVMESLRNRVQNDATVTYYLLLDNRFRVPSGYLESEFQETTDSGSNPMRPSPVGQWVPSPMDQYGLGGRSQAPSDRKWALGLQSHAHPREIMNEVLKALQELNVCWKKIGHYNMKCRWVPCFADGLNTRDNNQLHFGDDSSIIEDDCAMTSPTVIKFELQLYKAREEKYLRKIQVDGASVVDEEASDLCRCSLEFESYWISIYDGLVSIGKGRYPFQNLVFQWQDAKPNCSVQYVGLSSWDKHVGYRNVSVFPVTHNHISLWRQVGDEKFVEEGNGCDYEQWGLGNFLESWELSDTVFRVGDEEVDVPAHKAILQASGTFPLSGDVIQLRGVSYPILHALLQYIYTGRTQILESELGPLRDLSSSFEAMPLVRQCEEYINRLKLSDRVSDPCKRVELSCPISQPLSGFMFPTAFPADVAKLKKFYSSGEYSDVKICLSDHGVTFQSHKVILSLWSVAFAKMFTNGMSESHSSTIYLTDVSPEAFKAMLNFMYSGELNMEDTVNFGTDLIHLLFLADRFGVVPLHQECCKMLLECLSEDSVCSVLQVVSSISSCKLIEEMCKRKFSMHFDYCTTASLDFVLLDQTTFSDILESADLTVTSEEKILDAVLMWCMKAEEPQRWEDIDELMNYSNPETLFKERLQSLDDLLPHVRFSLLPYELLERLENSNLSRQIPVFNRLVKEAASFLASRLTCPGNEATSRLQHRRSSFKELQYIRDGDSNGVLHFVGTSYGSHQWVNPVLAKKIIITSSSPTSRFTDPKALASKTYVGTSFAGPRMEDGRISSWWMVDLGEDHQLMCNYYTFRQDGSRAYARSWKFQGSMDGNTWTDLRVHENDQTMCKAGQFASWPITAANALLPFRFFRLVLTGPTADTSTPWNFCICYLELYGYFR